MCQGVQKIKISWIHDMALNEVRMGKLQDIETVCGL